MPKAILSISQSCDDNTKKLKEIIGSFDGNPNLEDHDYYIENMSEDGLKLINIDDATLFYDKRNGVIGTRISVDGETITLLSVVYTRIMGKESDHEPNNDHYDDELEPVW